MTKHERTKDLAAWAEETAAAVELEKWDEIDRDALVEELRDSARSQSHEFRSRLLVPMAHLLKFAAQPRKRSGSWESTIITQRASILDLLEESPSLRRKLTQAHFAKAWATSRKVAAAETRLSLESFPAECPWDLYSQILDSEWLPGSFQ